MNEYTKGEIIRIRPEWQDPGDAGLLFEVVGADEGKGRVDITPLGPEWESMAIRPTQTVTLDMIERVG
jgi:hypothetical protein